MNKLRIEQAEADIQRQILEYLKVHGIFAWRQNQGGMTATHNGRSRFVRFAHVDGISDIIGVLPGGRFMAIEVKRRGGKPTDAQAAFLERVWSEGGAACVADSLEAAIEFLDRESINGTSNLGHDAAGVGNGK